VAELVTLVAEAIGGQFESWVEPPQELITEVATRLARTPSIAMPSDPLRAMPGDALRAWQSVRETVPWDAVPPVGPVTGGRDGFVHFVQTPGHTRDPLGAARLLAAMTQARDAATAGQPLSFELLRTGNERSSARRRDGAPRPLRHGRP
jgi:hypothetical protein